MISIVLLMLLLLYLGILINSFEILAIAVIISVITYKIKDFRKQAWMLYVLALLVSVFSLVFYQNSIAFYMNRGTVGYAFFFVVMFAGVLPNKWGLTRALKKHRGVLSITGFILISSHALGHVFQLIGSVNIYGLIAYVIMVPLTIISFQVIRREIPPKDWFTIQKAAYAIYLVLFVHLFMVSSYQNKIVYAVYATLYINNKLYKEFRK